MADLPKEVEAKDLRARAPRLEDPSMNAWIKFKYAYENYKLAGGDKLAGTFVTINCRSVFSLTFGEKDIKFDELDLDTLAAKVEGYWLNGMTPADGLRVLWHDLQGVQQNAKSGARDVALNSVLEAVVKTTKWAGIYLDTLFKTVLSKEALADQWARRVLPAQVRERVMLERDERTIESTMAKAVAVVNEFRRAPSWSEPNENKVGGGHQPSPGKNKGKPVVKTGAPPAAKAPAPKGVASVKCYGCGNMGHYARECPDKDNRKPRTARPELNFIVDSQPSLEHELEGEDDAGADAPTPYIDMQVSVSATRQCASLPAEVLLDTGSSVDTITPQLVAELKKDGIVVKSVERAIRLANGTLMSINECVHVVLTGVRYGRTTTFEVPLLVVDTGNEIILGHKSIMHHGLLRWLEEPAAQASKANFDTDVDEFVRSPSGREVPVVPVDAVVDSTVRQFSNLFGMDVTEAAHVAPFVIELHNGGVGFKPMPPRRVSPARQAVLDKHVRELLEQQVIRPSSSGFVSPVVLAKKPNGTWRFCVDYRPLNGVTVEQKYPLPDAITILKMLGGNEYFGKLDMKSGYHQVPIAEDSKKYTAFVTANGCYEWNRMPFGLKCAPHHFAMVMAHALAGLVGEACFVYLDDIIVFGRDLDEYTDHLRRVLAALTAVGVKLNPDKCQLEMRVIEFLGHIVSAEGVTLSQSRVDAVLRLPRPTDAKTTRSFLGVTNYFGKFVEDYASIVKPLTVLTSAKKEFVWEDEQEAAWVQLRHAVAACPVLAHLDYAKDIYIRTDASVMGIGAVLFQLDEEGREEPVCFLSKAFSDVMTRWSTIEQEAYAVVYAVQRFHHYVQGHKFILQTDHRNLTYLHTAASPKVRRWQLALQEFDFDIVHIAGAANVAADGLSRLFVLREDDPAVLGEDAAGEDDAVVLTPAQLEQLQAVHNPVFGHRGVDTTLQALVELGFSATEWRPFVRQFIHQCGICQKVRLGRGAMQAALKTTMVHQPFEALAVDAVGPLPEDVFGNRYILVCIDVFSRFVELRATKNVTAKEAAVVLLDICGRYGAPRELRSDRGSQFNNHVISQLLTLLGTGRAFTPAHRPQVNGIVERANGEVMRHLRALVHEVPMKSEWSVLLLVV